MNNTFEPSGALKVSDRVTEDTLSLLLGCAPGTLSAADFRASLYEELSAVRLTFDNPEYWRKRAEESRGQAACVTDDRTQRILLGIAVDYEFLADQAEQRSPRPRRETEADTS